LNHIHVPKNITKSRFVLLLKIAHDGGYVSNPMLHFMNSALYSIEIARSNWKDKKYSCV